MKRRAIGHVIVGAAWGVIALILAGAKYVHDVEQTTRALCDWRDTEIEPDDLITLHREVDLS